MSIDTNNSASTRTVVDWDDAPKQPKQLTQAVFDGLPPEYRWAYLDRDGDPCVIGDFEAELDARFPDHQPDCYEDGLELATWMDSVLWRKESITDVARSIEAARVAEQSERTYPHYFKDVSGVDAIDLYHVARLYDITDPALFHAFKKIACAGKRGAKDQAQDVQEAIDALKRWQELNSGSCPNKTDGVCCGGAK